MAERGRRVRPREMLAGVAGLGLHRTYLSGSDDEVRALCRATLDALEADDEPGVPVRECDRQEGYALWAERYHDVTYAYQRDALAALLAQASPGRALDAACGTGRHLETLRDLGHDVCGFDASGEMLERARRRVPSARLEQADLAAIPWPAASFDLVLCSMALTHLRELEPAIRELARVLRPGGRAVLCDMHPSRVLLDGHALFLAEDGAVLIRNHVHLHGEYLAAFAAAGLRVRRCLEPVVSGDDAGPSMPQLPATVTHAAYRGWPMALLWDLRRG